MKLVAIIGLLFCLHSGHVQSAELPVSGEKQSEKTSSGAVTDSGAGASYLLCKSGSTVRTIRVEQKGIVCRSIYTKEGVDQILGKSSKPGACAEVISKVRHTLENAKWTCRDISETRVSASVD